MKIRSIRLTAYGPFTDTIIDLASGGTDFHLLYGPNEAGKSSALRALRHMLFGIPARTGDNFLHGYAHLRVGAGLIKSDGETIDFVRRKGQAKTLRGGDDDAVLDDDALTAFLGGVSQELFEQMFAIGHDDLIRGGEEIISGKGRIGEALFAAGAGLIRLQSIQQGLDQACGALFKPSGSTPAINQTVAALKTVRKEQKEALLLARTWQDHDRRLRQARQRMEAVQETLGLHKQRMARLQRIRDALPLVARKREIDAELVAFKDVPDLTDDFGEQRLAAERDLAVAARDLARSRENIEKISRRMEALTVPDALLKHASGIESLQHELGSFRKAQKDRPGLEGRMRTLLKQAGEILAVIDAETGTVPGRLPKLPPSITGEIQSLGKTFEHLTAKLESATARERKLKTRLNRLTELRSAMPVPVDVSPLEAAVASAQEAGPLDARLNELKSTLQAMAEDLKHRIGRQTLWRGSPEAVEVLPFPAKETVDRFEKAVDAAGRRIEKAREARQKTKSEIDGLRTELEAIDLSHDVPSESDLSHARAWRDRQWDLIRQTLDGRGHPATAGEVGRRLADDAQDLPDAFEASMKQADHIADRLRREADQVSRKGLLAARGKQFESVLAGVDAELEAAIAAQRESDRRWQQVWEPVGIAPLSPPEMRAWLVDMEQIREKAAGLRADRKRCETLSADLERIKSGLIQALDAAGAPLRGEAPLLSGLIKLARTRISAQSELSSRILSADGEILALKGELSEGTAEIDDLTGVLGNWKTEWERNVGQIGLSADASPTAALAVIESMREAGNKFNEADVLQKRIDGIDRDGVAFENRVDELAAAAAAELKDEPRDRIAELLNGRLTAARKDESKRLGLTEQLEAAKSAENDAERRLIQGRAVLESLCREAGSRSADTLAEAEKRARQRKELIRTRANVDDQLRHLSAGATIEDFMAEAMRVDGDSIDPELETLSDETERLERERSELDQAIGIEKAERRRMNGSAVAAGHAEKAENLLAGLESDVEQYARLKIASIILARTVEQYRDKHQGPLISRASELFARMTRGAFSRLRAEYDDKGNPILVGIRSRTEGMVTVDGMSDGTADQLYLALRLASLEQYLENNEPLPFIVDDILLRFDDERALATLRVLAELSAKTQLLFFTHHRHLVELVQNSPQLRPLTTVQTLNG